MDFTRLNTFLQCSERYNLAYNQSLQKIKEDAYDLPRTFGQGIHAGLQAHYHGKPAEDSNKAFLAEFSTVVENELCRTPTNGIALLNAYRAYWKNPDAEMKVLGIEVVDHVEIGAKEPWEVKLDLIVETPNGIWGMDHKTTQKALNEQYWRTFEPNSQISGYTYYLLKKYGQCSGFIINGIKVGFRQRAYKGEPAGFHWEFQRQYFNRTQRQLEDWRQNVGQVIHRMRQTTNYEKNESQCGFCQFRELCMSVNDPSVRETLYETHEALAYLEPT